jgi:hypothetical protein
MRIVAAFLGLALATAGVRPARAQEIRPTFNGLEGGSDAAEIYRLNAIEIVHEQMSARFPTIFVGREHWWRPVRGKFRWATPYDDFYLKMGRDDLGERDRRRGTVASMLWWGGVLVMVSGVGVLLTSVVKDTTMRFAVGGGMIAGGGALPALGSHISPPLVSEEDAEAMAREYNRRLQIHLGLPPVAAGAGRGGLPMGFTLSRRWCW